MRKYVELIANGNSTCQNFWTVVTAVEGNFIAINVYIRKKKTVSC